MTDDARHRLLNGARVSLLVLEEIRSAQKEGREHDPAMMYAAASWAEIGLRVMVTHYNAVQAIRRAYR
jgi:hypothetical protein